MAIANQFARSVCVIVAHPDDETLWAGGAMLLRPQWKWQVFALCRASDSDRAPKFYRALSRLGATGGIADLDDSSDQPPLAPDEMEAAVLDLIGGASYHLLLTHGFRGEYTTHRRHLEVSQAVSALWRSGRIAVGEVWRFAYEDGGGAYLPRPAVEAEVKFVLPKPAWKEKRQIIVDVYGFAPDSWEARAAPGIEAFRRFRSPEAIFPS
jgi:LmbE family N-acetylglucosaminyl deacetylase